MSGTSDDDLPPTTMGSAGLLGRRQVRPVNAEELEQPDSHDHAGNPVWSKPRAPGKAIPPSCLRTLNSPLQQGCRPDCPGVQRDGGCLCDVVRAATAARVDWSFEVDPHDRFWDYAGDPIPGFETRRGDFGQIHTKWLPGFEPAEPFATGRPAAPSSFECPFCAALNEQDPANFHWWCQGCGRNAKEAD